MNRNVMIVGAAVVVIILGVIGYKVLTQGKSSEQSAMKPAAAEPTKNPNEFSSIEDALSKNLSLECSFSTDEGMQIHAFVKNGKVRSDVTGKTAQMSGSTIIMDKKIYFWNSTTAIMMAEPDMTSTPSASPSVTPAAKNQDVMKTMEEYKKDCHAATVADSEFVLPTGVKFTDESEMMKGAMMPSGAKTPSYPSGVPTQYQQMMQHALTPTQNNSSY